MSYCYCSVTESCVTLCDPTDCSMPDFPVLHHFPEFVQTHVHWVNDAIQLSHPLFSPSLAFSFSQHQDLFQWVDSSYQGAKVLELQLQHQSFQWNIQGWFLLGVIGLILQSKGFSRVFSNTTVQKHQSFVLSLLYGPALASVHDYWKNHSFDSTDLCRQNDVSAFKYTV